MASSVKYSEEQLNYFRICYVTTDILTEGLREIFKQEWDSRYKATLGEWKDDPKNGLDFWNGESLRNQKKHARLLTTMTKGNRAEWDCTMLFYAILFSDCIHSLNPVVWSNVDKLRLFRNEEFAHIARGRLSDVEFQNAIGKVENAFLALGLSIVKIQDVKTQTCFPTEQLIHVLKKVDDLKQEVQEKEREVQEKEKEVREKDKNLQEKEKAIQENNKKLQEKGKELQQKEEQRQTLEEQLNSEASSFCILPPKPSHDVANRDSDVSKIIEQLKALKNSTGLSYLYLSGNPGSGKSQIASLVANNFFDEVKGSTSFVMTLNAENSKTLMESYATFARHLKCPEYAVTNTLISKDLSIDEKIRSLRTLISTKIELYSSWLLIVDNVTNMSHLDGNLPDPGNGQCAKGQLLITTQDTASIPPSGSFIQHIPVSKGMEPHEAGSLLEMLSGFNDPEMEKEVARVLDYQPLALASAATYVREVRKNKLTPNFGWDDFLKKLDQGKRSTTEAMLSGSNPSYKKSMTAATTLAVKKTITTDKVLEHTFHFLSVCAPHPLSLEIVVNYLNKVNEELKDPDILATRICKCSLLLFEEDDSGVYMRVHQIVHDVINAVMKTFAENKELEAVDGAILSFYQVIGHALVEDDSHTLIRSKNIVPHLVTLSEIIDGLFSEEGITDAIKAGSSTPYDYRNYFQTLGHTCQKHCEFRSALRYFNATLRLTQCDDVFGDEDIVNAYGYIGTAYHALGHLQQAKECHDRALTTCLKKLGPEHIEVAYGYDNLGAVHHDLGDLQQAKKSHDRALTIRLKRLGPEHVDVAYSYNNLGTVHYALGDLLQAKECHDRALTIRLRKLVPEHVNVAYSYNNLGAVHHDLGDLLQAKECHDRALAIRLKKLGPEHVDVANSYNNLGVVHHGTGDLQQAKECHDLALTIRLKKLGPEHVDVAYSYDNLGTVHYALGDLPQAKECHDRALAIRLKTLGPEHVNVANSYDNLGTVHNALGELLQAKECYDRALTINLKKLEPEHVNVAYSYNNLGAVHHDLGDLQQAKVCHDRALAIRLRKLGPEHVSVAYSYNNLGAVHHDLGDLQQAKECHDRSLSIRLKKLGPEHINVAYSYNNLGTVHYGLGDLRHAKECHDRALAIRLKKLGPEHVDVAYSYDNLGTVHYAIGDLQQAKECHDRALTIRLKKLVPEHVIVAYSYNNLGAVHHDLGDLQQAKEFHDRALTIRLKKLGPEHVDVANSYNNLGVVYHGLGNLMQAKEYHHRALTIRLKKLGPKHVNVANSYNNLGAVHHGLGDLQRAKECHDRALAIRLKILGLEHVDVAQSR
nr:uncharacterized protein LOC131780124 [Pocillopora verrucosa]